MDWLKKILGELLNLMLLGAGTTRAQYWIQMFVYLFGGFLAQPTFNCYRSCRVFQPAASHQHTVTSQLAVSYHTQRHASTEALIFLKGKGKESCHSTRLYFCNLWYQKVEERCNQKWVKWRHSAITGMTWHDMLDCEKLDQVACMCHKWRCSLPQISNKNSNNVDKSLGCAVKI